MKHYGVNFFDLTRIKISLFLVLLAGILINQFYPALIEDTVIVAQAKQLIPSLVFFALISYVLAAFIEFIYLKVR